MTPVFSLQLAAPQEGRASRSVALTTFLALAFSGASCDRPAAAPAAAPRTVEAKPLPDASFRVEWTPVDVPTTMEPGELARIPVTFKNAGTDSWPASGDSRELVVRLSHRWWRGSDGELASDYSGRVDMLAPLVPGQSATLVDAVRAPLEPGDYLLQFDLVQEGVAWFADRGAARKLVLVKIQQPAGGPATAQPAVGP